MYKYKKEAKEQLLKDNAMAFFWMFYRYNTCRSEISVE
jgi:hypothetical protein